MRNELGKISLGFILFILVMGIVLDATFQIVPAYINYFDFKAEVESRAREPQQEIGDFKTKIRTGLINKAADLKIPLDPEQLKVDFGDHTTHISASWVVTANLLGGHFTRKLPFTIEVNEPNYRS